MKKWRSPGGATGAAAPRSQEHWEEEEGDRTVREVLSPRQPLASHATQLQAARNDTSTACTARPPPTGLLPR